MSSQAAGRRAADRSQQRLAELLGWDVTGVKRLEAGQRPELASAFACTVGPLLGSLYPDSKKSDADIKAEMEKLAAELIQKGVGALLAGDRRELIEEAARQMTLLPRRDFDYQCESIALMFNNRRERGGLTFPEWEKRSRSEKAR